MASLYDIDFNLQTDNLINPLHQAQENMDYIGSMSAELQYLRDILLGDFKVGGVYSLYNNATAYSAGNRVILASRATYERRIIDDSGAVIGTTTGIPPAGALLSTQTWRKINDNYIGVDDRKRYNGQLIIMSKAINDWFKVTTAPYFYIVNNNTAGLGFELYCPAAVFATLGPTATDRENAVREFVYRFAVAGMVYPVFTY